MKALLTLLTALVAAPAAHACSVIDGYRVPTNLELAEQADTILIGTVTGPAKDPGEARRSGGPLETGVTVVPSDLLKGAALPPMLALPGMIAEKRFANVRSNPAELRDAHPLAYIGGCVRYMFPRGARVLFFLARDDAGRLVPLGMPFARTAEDVVDADARWAKAVKIYVEIAALPAAERRAALVARRDALLHETGDPDAQAIAADIAVELSASKETWNERMEREINAMKRPG